MPQPTESPRSLAGREPADLSDGQVVERVLAGDRGAFELIMRRYNRRLFRVARSLLGDDHEAEDVLQDAYVRAFEKLRQFEHRARFSTWLTRIVIHEALGRRKKRSRVRLVDPQVTEAGPMLTLHAHDDVAANSSRQELRRILVDAVDSLPNELRVVFTMRLIEGLDTAETAACLQLSESNVKVRLHRARAQLRRWIDQKLGEEVRQLFQFDGERCDRIVLGVLQQIAADS
ncbi:ECF RNA polymerase sigma factor SigW [Maioricimonas rarisocia]|uniref:RNA polymerase sigma factor n=1 Tax=Maioricimonas rarisocia TaxID=2528026 RepID=A0A517ZDR6_9PLAN|nr:RNA polymerase sigma factor [Maioricimonas rarisocia]QDU40615.1 ECF RNA polymerase sigma factor SigW [Maioricimonas rarisocia]